MAAAVDILGAASADSQKPQQQHQKQQTSMDDDDEEPFHLAGLFLAARDGDAARVKQELLLLPPTAEINGRNRSGETVVHVAVPTGSLPILEALHQRGVDMHQLNRACENGLHIACRLGDINVARFFVERAAVCLDGQTKDGDSPVHLAVKKGHAGVVEYLGSRGANLNAQDRSSETPLHAAAAVGSVDCVRALVQAGARIYVEDRVGWTSLEHAIKRHQTTIALMLINAGAPIDHVDHQKRECPLHLACREGLLPVVQALCAYGCRVDVYNALGVTPLHIASRAGHLELVRCLLLAGASPQLTSRDGVLPEVMALAQNHTLTASLLGKMRPERRAICVEQLVPTQRPLPRIKLKVFGDSASGKSSLIGSLRSNAITGFFRKKFKSQDEANSLDDESQTFSMRSRTMPVEMNFEAVHEAYTKGIQVQNIGITGAGDFSVWEFSGYQPYYLFYDHFIGDTSCVHLILFNLMDSFELMRQKVMFWVNFVMGRIPAREPLGFCGKPKSMARIALVGTHSDRAAGLRNAEGLLENRDADRILEEVMALTRYRLDVCDRIFVVNTSEAMSPEMKALRSQLADWRTEILRHLPFSNGFLDVVISRISEWVSGTQFPVYTWQQFVETVRNKVNPLCSEDHLKDLIQELQYTGEVIYLESDAGHDMIVLSPQWLCSGVLGFLLSQDNISQARVTGSFTADDIQFMIAGTEANQLLRILTALDLCTQVEVEDEIQFEFPSLNFLDSVRGLWEKEPRHDASIYAGMQVRAAKSQLVHIFPRLQCSLRRSLKVDKDDELHSAVLSEADLFQWHHGSKLSLAGIECMLRMEECDQVIRLRARGPLQQLQLLFGVYQDMVNLIEQTIEDTCPSMEYEVSVLSPKELRNHSKVAIAVPQGVVFRAIEDQRNRGGSDASEVIVNFEEGLVLESLESLLCFGSRQLLGQLTLGPDLHLSCLRTPAFQRLCSMFDPVDPLGKDWCLLAVRLGMTQSVPTIDSGNEWLRSRTAKILDEWGKEPGGTIGALIAIFRELGRDDAAELLMDSAPLYQYSPSKAETDPTTAGAGNATAGKTTDTAGATAHDDDVDQAVCDGSGSTLSR